MLPRQLFKREASKSAKHSAPLVTSPTALKTSSSRSDGASALNSPTSFDSFEKKPPTHSRQRSTPSASASNAKPSTSPIGKNALKPQTSCAQFKPDSGRKEGRGTKS